MNYQGLIIQLRAYQLDLRYYCFDRGYLLLYFYQLRTYILAHKKLIIMIVMQQIEVFFNFRQLDIQYNKLMQNDPKSSQQEQIQEVMSHERRRKTYFNLNKNIDLWKDFMNTWKNCKFNQDLNSFNQEQLQSFWKNQLDILSQEAQKICILVPVQVDKKEVSKLDLEVKQTGDNINQSTKEHQKQKHENQKIKDNEGEKIDDNKGNKARTSKKQSKNQKYTKPTNQKVKLKPTIIQTAISLISQYPSLSYIYESLFLGKPKQLLLYRYCSAIERYLQKYRLPVDFNTKTEELKRLTQQAYHLKLQKNLAISQFNKKEYNKIKQKNEKLTKNIQIQTDKLKPFLKNILDDFRSKQKCKQICLIGIRQEFKQILTMICRQFQCEVITRYDDTDHFQIKDIYILKKQDHRAMIQLSFQEENENDQNIQQKEKMVKKKKYIYIKPQKQNEPPSDLRQITFKQINFKKQCYTYTFYLGKKGQHNMPQGLFIRSPLQNDRVYELNVDIQSDISKIQVDIYPYQHGKSIYEIYIWNSIGFTKSTEKIILYNQLGVTQTQKKQNVMDYNFYLLGQSDSGLIVDKKQISQKQEGVTDYEEENKALSTQDEFMKVDLNGLNFSMCNSVVLCDKQGGVGAWGQLYYYYADLQKQKEFDIIGNRQFMERMKIQRPFLLTADKLIRKISCGLGYCLLLSSFGAMYSMGINSYGQLGLGHYRNEAQNMQPRQVCKFTDSTSPFLVDVIASISGASFAINDQGHCYRWGLNQVQQTNDPVFDRFNSIINYTNMGANYKQSNPFKIKKSFIQGKIKQIQSGNHFYFALTEANILFGWGQCKYLGCGVLLDRKENKIPYIVNPIQLRKNVKYISSGPQHSIIITTDNKILGWGKSHYFTTKRHEKQFYDNPIDITEEYGPLSSIKNIKCGKSYTAIVNQDSMIEIIGNKQVFKKNGYKLEGRKISDIICNKYEDIIGVASPKPIITK